MRVDGIGVLPSRALCLTLSNEEFRIDSGLRLGAPVTSQYTCKCGTVARSDGQHAMICPRVKARFQRHNNCNEVIQKGLKSAGVMSTLEPVGLLRQDGRRPDGLTLTPWVRGRTVAWDFTCISRLASSNRQLAMLPGPNAANEAEARKRRHYADLPSTVIFQPIGVENLGGIGSSGLAFLRSVAQRIETLTDEKQSFKFLKQRLDLTVQRGNAACIQEAIDS
jgi:hypothetical protein